MTEQNNEPINPNIITVPILDGLNQIANDLALAPLPFDRHKLDRKILNGIAQRLLQADEMEARLKELEPPPEAEKPAKKTSARGRRTKKTQNETPETAQDG